MFDQTFVDTNKKAPPYALALSLFVQVLVLGVVLLIPLLYTQVLPGVSLRSVLAAPAPTTPPPPAPPARALVKTPARSNGRVFSIPALIFSRATARQSEAPAAPEVGLSEWPEGVYEGQGLTTGSAPPLPPPAKTPPRRAVRIGGGVSEANVIHRVQPLYPPLARTTRVEGTVEFTATISKGGTIENLQLVRGHPLLVNAAREAILQWRYRPTLLNGEPVEVITDIIVKFTLGQGG
jgi:periplasmic protein TonB